VSTITYPAAGHMTPAPRLRLTARGRIVVGALIAAPVVVFALLVGLGAPGAQATAETGTVTFTTVSIAPGQTLWDVAVRVAPDADPREVIADILALNNLSSGDVQPGQKLAIPAEYVRP